MPPMLPTPRYLGPFPIGHSNPLRGTMCSSSPPPGGFPPVAEQLDLIREGADAILPEAELAAKLERSRREGRPLVIKQGFDPTRPDLHIGHAVSLWKLRAFQDLGHQVVFVMGDFTARVGDPSGRDETRPMLSREAIEENLVTYREQMLKVLGPDRTMIRRNSEWLGPLTMEDILRLLSGFTVSRMLERDDFAKRHAAENPIRLVEFLYPVLQAYDSVMLEADVELGGVDQLFNLLAARTFQERAGQEPQVCLTMPLLRGTDGKRKMSKTYDNYVGLAMDPDDSYGRVMSIPDDLLDEWISLASGERGRVLAEKTAWAKEDPLAAKRWLARTIVERYHGGAAAGQAAQAFDRVHRQRRIPETIPKFAVTAEPTGDLWIARALVQADLAASTSEACRLVKQGAVRVNGNKETRHDARLAEGEYLLQRGKRRFARLVVAPV